MIIPGMTNVEAADLENMGALLPEGTYLSVVDEAEEGTTDKGYPFIKLVFIVQKPEEFAGRKLFDRMFFSEASLPFAKAKLAAINFATDTDREFQPAQIKGRAVLLTVIHESRFNKDGLPRTYATVTVWRKVGEGTPELTTVNPPVSDDDDIPF